MQKQFEQYLQSKNYILLIMTAFNSLYDKFLYLSLNSLLKSKVKGLRFINSFVSAIK